MKIVLRRFGRKMLGVFEVKKEMSAYEGVSGCRSRRGGRGFIKNDRVGRFGLGIRGRGQYLSQHGPTRERPHYTPRCRARLSSHDFRFSGSRGCGRTLVRTGVGKENDSFSGASSTHSLLADSDSPTGDHIPVRDRGKPPRRRGPRICTLRLFACTDESPKFVVDHPAHAERSALAVSIISMTSYPECIRARSPLLGSACVPTSSESRYRKLVPQTSQEPADCG